MSASSNELSLLVTNWLRLWALVAEGTRDGRTDEALAQGSAGLGSVARAVSSRVPSRYCGEAWEGEKAARSGVKLS